MSDVYRPGWMTDELILLEESVARFFARELTPNIERWNREGVVEREFWLKAGAMGLLGASTPEQYGGLGGTLAHDVVILTAFARVGDPSWGIGLQNIVIHYLLNYGTEEQKQKWLPSLVSGEKIAAIAMTEPDTGSDLQAVKTTALKDGDYYVINGAKIFISNGQAADLIVVVAKTDPAQRAKGVSLIVVETEQTPGFSRGRRLEKLGWKGQDTAELFFSDARVPAANLLGGVEGQGFYQLMSQLAWERLMNGIATVSTSWTILQETLAYVKQRKAFGKRVMDFQNTRFKLAEAKIKLEVAEAYVNQCVEKLLRGELTPVEASIAKCYGSDIQNQIADECLQLFGGYGYMMEYPIARYFADARITRIFAGTNEILKELIARSLDD